MAAPSYTGKQLATILRRPGYSVNLKHSGMSEDELDRLIAGEKSDKDEKPAKYYNIKVVIDGITFDSKKEAREYQYLKLLQESDQISGLRLQPRYLLREGFDRDGKRVRPIYYVADFEYLEAGQLVAVDVKGKRTKEYIIKRKLFVALYPHIKHIEK